MERVTLVSVVIVNWNGRDLISECLEGLSRQVFRPFKTILVDNGSIDGSVEFLRERYPDVEIIALPENVGFSKANNLVLQSIDTKYAALLNNDAVPDPFWLSSLVTTLESMPAAGFAASMMVLRDNPQRVDRAGDAYTIAGAGLLRGRGHRVCRHNRKKWLFGACGAAALYRTKMLREIGFFDEDFFLLYEDVDLSFRAQLMGYRCIYVPEAVVRHTPSSTLRRHSRMSVFYSHRNLEWVYLKNMPAGLIVLTIIPHVIYILTSFLYFCAIGQGFTFLRAKGEALMGLAMMMKKRRAIQVRKKVGGSYIWKLLEPEFFFDRLDLKRMKLPTLPSTRKVKLSNAEISREM